MSPVTSSTIISHSPTTPNLYPVVRFTISLPAISDKYINIPPIQENHYLLNFIVFNTLKFNTKL